MKPITERAALRNSLLSNGYRPLPLHAKGIFIRGWSHATIDADWLQPYQRSARYINTGIRCDDLAAIDIDVLDEALADTVEGMVETALKPTSLCRVGRWPKRLLLYRLKGKGPFRAARTGRYGPDKHLVELLAGHGRQFAAYGTHPSGVAYEWCDDTSPLDVPYKKLPAIDYAQALDLLDTLDGFFLEQGFELRSPRLDAGLAGAQEWDLTDATPVEIEGQPTTWGEIRPALTRDGLFGNLIRENGEFGDSNGVHFYLAQGSLQPCAHDFVRDCTHWDCLPTDALAEALPEPPSAIDSLFTPDEFKALLEDWVLVKDGTVRRFNDPLRAYELPKFHAAMQHMTIPAPTKANPMQTEPATKAWARHPETLRADYVALRPDYPDDAFVDDVETGARVFNSYMPPEHAQTGGEIATVLEFIEHLLPRKSERELFMDWNALKVANPGARLHGLIMVTPAYGTGRGTWSQILAKLFGEMYVFDVQLSKLLGRGSQGQYTEYLAQALIVNVPEAYEENEEQSRWSTRHASYENLKVVCEPAATRMLISRKYGKNSVERVFASIFASTNHADALAIEPGDRRLIVLDNTETPLLDAPGNLIERIHDWKEKPENIGALQRYFVDRAMHCRYDPMGMPPLTAAKERMIEAGQSDTDRAFDWMLDNFAGDIITPQQWRKASRTAQLQLGLDLPQIKLDAALTAVLEKRARRTGLGRRQIKLDGHPFRVWAIRHFEAWIDCVDTQALREQIAKNGVPGGDVVSFPGGAW